MHALVRGAGSGEPFGDRHLWALGGIGIANGAHNHRSRYRLRVGRISHRGTFGRPSRVPGTGTGSRGAGVVLGQRGTPGSNQQNRITQNAIYANGSVGIDLDVTNTGAGDQPDGDGVTANDGAIDGTLPNLEMDYPVITDARVSGSSLVVEGYVGTASTKVAHLNRIGPLSPVPP